MNYFFENIERQKMLETVLWEWVGTPYRHWSGVKHGGTDCIHFVAGVLGEVGYPRKFKIKRYPPDWHMHNSEELLLNGIRSQTKNQEFVLTQDRWFPENGDIILSEFGKTCSHASFYYNQHLFHAINCIGVIREHWKERKWFKRFRYAFRLI